jgi:RNA-splicing ligase RtcB
MSKNKNKLDIIQLPKLPLDKASQGYAEEILSQGGVEKILLFPDSFTKSKYVGAEYKTTVPSSVVIQTDTEHLYPSFRSRGINCGMMLVSLPIKESDLTEGLINKIKTVFLYSFPYYASFRLRFPFFRNKYDLSYNEFLKVLENGAPSLEGKLNISKEDMIKLEDRGTGGHLNINEVKKYFDPKWLNRRTVRMRYSFGRYFGGNHYFEIQVVEDPGSDKLGLKKGQAAVMLHTGCQSLEDVVRPDLRENFIRQKSYKSVSKDSEMYEAFFMAQKALTNLIRAYRLTSFAMLRDIFGNGTKIVLERGHNYVSEEKGKLIYRHNAERLENENFAIVSGNFKHPSYVVEGGEGTKENMHSIDHGVGSILTRAEKNERKRNKNVRILRSQKGLHSMLTEKNENLIENPIVEDYFALMESKGIVRANKTKLRPILNLKYTK